MEEAAMAVKIEPNRGRYRRRITFRQYLRFRLGSTGGVSTWFNFFVKPFGAASLSEFWRLWNPVYGYFLYYYAYRPLSRTMPRGLAKMVTFVLCGFALHDVPAWVITRRILPPGATIAFVLFGLGAVVSDAFHMDMSRWSFAGRATVIAGYLATSVIAMLAIVRYIVPIG
jgi:D-alanyl-lipoteichoic acid acyltransferase DltB (MBOAT superfamily)